MYVYVLGCAWLMYFCVYSIHLPSMKKKKVVLYIQKFLLFFAFQTKGVAVTAWLATAEKNRRPFFKIIDAAVVVAYTSLLINDRFCSRTSSLRCRQYCLSSASLSLFWSKQPRPYMENKNCLQNKKKKKKKTRTKKMPDTHLRIPREREKETDTLHLLE